MQRKKGEKEFLLSHAPAEVVSHDGRMRIESPGDRIRFLDQVVDEGKGSVGEIIPRLPGTISTQREEDPPPVLDCQSIFFDERPLKEGVH